MNRQTVVGPAVWSRPVDIVHHRLRGLLLLMAPSTSKTPFHACFNIAVIATLRRGGGCLNPLELNRGRRWTE